MFTCVNIYVFMGMWSTRTNIGKFLQSVCILFFEAESLSRALELIDKTNLASHLFQGSRLPSKDAGIASGLS